MRVDYIPVPPTEESPNYAVTGVASPTSFPLSYFSFIMPFEFHVLTVTTLALGAGNMDGMLMMQTLCPRGLVLSNHVIMSSDLAMRQFRDRVHCSNYTTNVGWVNLRYILYFTCFFLYLGLN